MRTSQTAAIAAFALTLLLAGWSSGPDPLEARPSSGSAILDDFDSGFAWVAESSAGTEASVHHVRKDGVTGGGLRLDFDFKGGSGYAIARRPIQLNLPEDYRFSLQVRGHGTVAKLEIKLIDASGENVWWKTYRDFAFAEDWQKISINKREIRFAWGPTDDRILRQAAYIEFVVVAAEERGSGSVYFDNLAFQRKEPQPARWELPDLDASSALFPHGAPEMAFDGDQNTAWHSQKGGAQTLTVDFGRAREFGALALYWGEDAYPADYDVVYSDDGEQWRVETTAQGQAGRQRLYLKDSVTRFLQLRLKGPERGHYALQELEIKDGSYGDSLNSFIQGIASESPRGTFPRALSGEQVYWTIVGVDGGAENGLISEDGAVEVGRGLFSLEPFVVSGNSVSTWADVAISQSLLEGYLPIPSVHWRHRDWQLTTTSLASGDTTRSTLATRYELTNLTGNTQELQLAVAVRPFQVNSPEQVLNTPGGVSPINHIAWDGTVLHVNNSRLVRPLTPADEVVLGNVSTGAVPEILRSNKKSSSRDVADPTGLASATFLYRFSLQPGAKATVVVTTPLDGERNDLSAVNSNEKSSAWFEQRLTATSEYWRARLNLIEIRTPQQGQRIFDTVRSSLAHILISRDGINLRPGTRNYGHSWIRDGAMISEGLLRMGLTDIPRKYARWFASHQFENGKVPCCVTQYDAADPVPENDSHGQLIFLIAEIYRYTGDRELVEQLWSHVKGAVAYMDEMRRNEQRPENQQGDRKILYGLLEPSISHEGYPLPAYSIWDNFWGLKGYSDAVELSVALGYGEDEERFARSRDEFRKDLFNSILASARQHQINYIPGAAEQGDFDATSTTIALAPGGEQDNLPQDLLIGTFDRYWREFVARRDGEKDWSVYTPYELRTVGTFVRLGWRDRAHELLEYFFADRRPEPWNQWAEVVGKDKRQARFIGDMPHAWISSDYIRSALDLFAYHRERDDALVLAAGIPGDWITADGVGIKRMRTAYGELSYSLSAKDGQLLMSVELLGEKIPPGGMVFPWPFDPANMKSATINGDPAEWHDGEFAIVNPAAKLLVRYAR